MGMRQLFGWLAPSKPGRAGGHCVLRFPDSMETRWFDQIPTPGMRIRTHYGGDFCGRLWVVNDVTQIGGDTYAISCVERDEYLHNLQQRPGGKPDLSAELLERARRTTESITEERRKRKYRHYQP
jgi:hypothetical protein